MSSYQSVVGGKLKLKKPGATATSSAAATAAPQRGCVQRDELRSIDVHLVRSLGALLLVRAACFLRPRATALVSRSCPTLFVPFHLTPAAAARRRRWRATDSRA
jgi:hypothetical protein